MLVEPFSDHALAHPLTLVVSNPGESGELQITAPCATLVLIALLPQ